MPISGEPGAVKVARRVRWGESGNLPRGKAPGSYPTTCWHTGSSDNTVRFPGLRQGGNELC